MVVNYHNNHLNIIHIIIKIAIYTFKFSLFYIEINDYYYYNFCM